MKIERKELRKFISEVCDTNLLKEVDLSAYDDIIESNADILLKNTFKRIDDKRDMPSAHFWMSFRSNDKLYIFKDLQGTYGMIEFYRAPQDQKFSALVFSNPVYVESSIFRLIQQCEPGGYLEFGNFAALDYKQQERKQMNMDAMLGYFEGVQAISKSDIPEGTGANIGQSQKRLNFAERQLTDKHMQPGFLPMQAMSAVRDYLERSSGGVVQGLFEREMKLTRSKIKRLVREEVRRLVEMQVSLGLPHEFSNEVLYQHCLNFLSENPSIEMGTPEYSKAEGLLKILNNRIKSAGVFHQGSGKFDPVTGEYSYVEPTSQQEMEYAREIQAKLSMVRKALADVMGIGYEYDGMSRARKDFYR